MSRFLYRPGRAVAVLCAAVTLMMGMPAVVSASEPCNPPNVIPRDVCDFDSFRGSPPRQIPNGWNEFILSGDATFESHNDTFWGPPSLMIRNGGGTFKLGIYTQVSVTPGAGYRASLAWGAPNSPDTFGRQLGIDPTGGTDPNSPNVVWGPMHWGPGRILNYPPPDVNIDVKARAAGETVTVFFLIDHPRSTGDDLIFVDALALYPDESAPAVEIPPTETPTPEPVIVVQAAPTAPPVPTATATAIPTDTAVPTATPTFTPTPSPTPLPTFTPTYTPTWTPWPTATPAGLSSQFLETAQSGTNGALLFVGMIGFCGAGIFGGSWLRVRRRRRR